MHLEKAGARQTAGQVRKTARGASGAREGVTKAATRHTKRQCWWVMVEEAVLVGDGDHHVPVGVVG